MLAVVLEGAASGYPTGGVRTAKRQKRLSSALGGERTEGLPGVAVVCGVGDWDGRGWGDKAAGQGRLREVRRQAGTGGNAGRESIVACQQVGLARRWAGFSFLTAEVGHSAAGARRAGLV